MQTSVVIPCRNEGANVIAVLDDLALQRGVAAPWEVVVADGSIDGTRALLAARASARSDPFQLQVVDNPEFTIPAGLNRAVTASGGRTIIRIDAHSRVDPDYIATMVANLDNPGVDIAGGLVYWIPAVDSLVARTISWCLNHPLGNGGTPGRNQQSSPRRVAHSPLSCFRREVWERIGGYDPTLLSNEDFDFDWRAAHAGFGVWTFPAPVYRAVARGGLAGLARQRWRYGFWKAQVVKRHPTSLSARQYIPPLTLIVGIAVVASVSAGFIHWAVLAALVVLVVGMVAVALAGARGHPHPGRRLPIGVLQAPVALAVALGAFAIIHSVWSFGLLAGLATPNRRRPSTRLETASVPSERPAG